MKRIKAAFALNGFAFIEQNSLEMAKGLLFVFRDTQETSYTAAFLCFSSRRHALPFEFENVDQQYRFDR